MVLDNEQLKSLVKFKTGTAIMSCLKFIILYVEDIAEKSKDINVLKEKMLLLNMHSLQRQKEVTSQQIKS